MIVYHEIEQTPKEAALSFYDYVHADLRCGLNYGVSVEAYNMAMAGIGSDKRTEAGVPAHQFAADFRAEWLARCASPSPAA